MYYKKLASLLMVVASLSSSSAFGQEGGDLERAAKVERVKNLTAAVTAECKVPANLNGYALYVFDRVVGQVVFPDLKILNTAFFHGFQLMNSSLMGPGYCIIAFLGQPNNLIWEKRHDFYAKALAYGTLPQQMLAGFDDANNVLLKATEDVN